MELRQVEYFLAVAETDSLSSASTHLGVGQPALSRSVRLLEEELGVQLFHRHGRGTQLTEKGTQFRAAVLPLIKGLQQAKSDLSAEVLSGSLSLALPPDMAGAIGAELVFVAQERHPKLRLEVHEGLSSYANDWLTSSRVDMAIIDHVRQKGIETEPLLAVDLYYIVHREDGDLAIPPSEEITFHSIALAPLILPAGDDGLRRQIEAATMMEKVTLDISAHVDAAAVTKEVVARRNVGAILPETLAGPASAAPTLLVRRIVEPELSVVFRIAYSPTRPTTAAMREVARMIRVLVERAVQEGRLAGRPA